MWYRWPMFLIADIYLSEKYCHQMSIQYNILYKEHYIITRSRRGLTWNDLLRVVRRVRYGALLSAGHHHTMHTDTNSLHTYLRNYSDMRIWTLFNCNSELPHVLIIVVTDNPRARTNCLIMRPRSRGYVFILELEHYKFLRIFS